MTAERTVEIPEETAVRLSNRLSRTEFDSVDEYAAFALDQLLDEIDRQDRDSDGLNHDSEVQNRDSGAQHRNSERPDRNSDGQNPDSQAPADGDPTDDEPLEENIENRLKSLGYL